MKTYLYIGNWSFEARPAKGKGISLFEYDSQDGSVKLIETICPEIAAGQLYLDAANGILYSNDECGERHGEIGGGGGLLAFKIDRTNGRLTLMNKVDSLGTEPSYLCMDKSGKYLTVSHMCDPFFVTKIIRKEDGTLGNEVIFCDGGLVLFRINDDGSIGPAVDASLQEGYYGKSPNSKRIIDPLSGHVQLTEVISRMHCVVPSPDGEVMIVCDKGMDRIYSYRIDREAGRLIHLDTWMAPVGSFPRYCAFNPANGLLYVNYERLDKVSVFSVDTSLGKMEVLGETRLFPEDYEQPLEKELCIQDVLISPNGRNLYVCAGGYDVIVELIVEEDGMPVSKAVLDSRGTQPRGLALSPDGRFFLSGNMVSGDITVFEVGADGLLSDTGRTYPAISPSALRFLVVE